jgi:triacylglycerol lipase
MRTPVAFLLILLIPACVQHTTVDFTAVEVDFRNMDWYAQRAQLAYSSKKEILEALDNVLYVETIPERDIQFYVEQLPDNRQLVSVRGTANFANVREDVEYRKSWKEDVHIFVHEGFDEDAEAVYKSALPHLDRKQEILLTGHSLGAAVSSLLMIYLHHDGFKIGPSVNFGQPKFTDRKGAEAYGFLNLTRVIDNRDLVPLLPPVTLLSSIHGEYHHFGREVILLNGPYYVYLNNHNVTEQDLSPFWLSLADLSVEDHFIANYRKNIADKLGKQIEVPFAQRHHYR